VFPDSDARDSLTAAMAGLVLGANDVEKLDPALDLDQAMAECLAAIDPNVRATLGALLSMNEGKDPDEVNFATFVSAFFAGGAQHEDVMPHGGYRRVVDYLADGLDIQLGQPVHRIEQGASGVTVHTTSEQFSGGHAIVTVPLGVLKANAIDFEPALPAAHAEAIERVGFGVLEKVALAYERPVLPLEVQPAHVTIVDSPRPEWPVILDYSTWYGKPVVVGMATGTFGRALAAMSEEQRVAALHEVICEIGGPDTPDPIASATTSWTTDPFVVGCYANIAPGTDSSLHATDLSTLATPHGRVLFAGEHTCERGTSTVDSAWHSGVREACRLMQQSEVPL
jgi:monoamine oxidase